ncbi:adenylate kinase 9 isoform X2 [Elephas maximus indicus]|uniref:adenylate kinase 9 isoform X2 n=1 Tax=Elephas maximus indicus TaxID=99487 RepID=UPI0021161E8D|nr:adenylate kinase 9 isoform X2 [Elephas maximus indicus]
MISQEKTEEYPFADIFNEDEAEKNFLLSKPVCFIIFGKPGVGKTTLARQIAQAWKCIRVEALPILEEQIAAETQTGVMLQALLVRGQSVPDELVIKIILDKLNSPEVSHFGYVITEMPSFSQEAITTLEQLELIKNLSLKPDIIINIKCPDFDLCQRISGQRQHSSTGYIYPRDQWDPEVIESRRKKKKDAQKEGKGEEEGEEEEEQEEEEAFIAEMQMVAEILQHLVQRPEDYLENIEDISKLYKETILHPIEEIMAEHNSQYLIELDGNKPPEELFLTVMERLKYLNLRRAAVITKLQSAEEEINDVMETDELFHTLASYKLIAPRYRWQRSRWGRTCPVTLKEGNIYSGLPDCSVSFLGKMYCLSSEEALKAFSLNPRPYLLPPMPAPPCKVFIFGPQYSGKTTLSNLLAEKYKGQVVDYAKLVQPRFDQALEKLIGNTIAEATETAIKVVQDKLLTELENRRQAALALREFQREFGRKEYEEFQMGPFKSLEDMLSSVEEDDNQETLREGSLEDTEETKMQTEKVSADQSAKSDKDGINNVLFTDEKESSEIMSKFKSLSRGPSQEVELSSKKVSIEDTIEEVTADHPEVVAMVEETIKMTKDMNFEQPYEKHAEILEEVLREVMKENKNRFPGAPKDGGWVVDNCPFTRELWIVLVEKGILPDLIICLSDMENNGKYLLNRLYLQNKPEIDAKILERLLDELQNKKKEEEAARKATEEALKIEEENRRMLEAMSMKAKGTEEAEEEFDAEGSEAPEGSEEPDVFEEARLSLLMEESEVSEVPETEPESVEPIEETTVETEIPKESKEGLETEKLSETVMLPEYPEDAYPDVPEMEPLKESIRQFTLSWKQLEVSLNDLTFIQILNLEIAGKTPEELLQKVVETMEKPFKYTGWELTMEDYDEETEDYQAEAEVDEELEEEEEEEEENEERIKEKRRHLGDTKHFCPVVLKENFILQPGNTEEAAKYREKIYYFSSAEAKEKFLEHPEKYVAHEEPLKAPPLRLCLLGPHGSGKTTCGRHLAGNLGIFHIQFDEVLQEKLMLKTEKKVGPEFEEESEDEQAVKQEIEELAVQANITIEEENTKKPSPEIHLTEEEEAIKSNLVDNEPLPPEILEGILSEWWLKEPICSTGFILDGFPRYPEEAQFLGERGFFPDAAVFIQVDDQDISDRLLPSHIEKWKLKQKKRLDRKKLIKDMKAKIRDDMIAKRRAELISEREKKKKREVGVKEDEDISEEEPEEEEDDSIDNILEEEFPKEEEDMSEEDEEQEIDATERLRSEVGEKFEADMSNLQIIQDEFEKFLIPIIHINGARKTHIVQYVLNTKVKPLVENRASIFEKCYPIAPHLAQKMLNLTYKYISSFGYWDPVKLSEGETIKPFESPENPSFPVIHRQYIYFLSSKESKEKFMKNPIKYIRQPKPKPTMPIRIAVVGPPKSGKTTVAQKIASECGLKRVSIGDALRYILNNQPGTELALMLNWHLHKGMTAPDELAIQALEICLMDSACNTAGVVIDGYPVTQYQMNLLEARTIIPMIIFELDVPSKEIFKRLLLEKKKEQSFPYPLHNSAQITAVKNSKHRKNIDEIRQYYQEQHQNWYVIDGFHSKWWIWNEVIKNIQMVNKCIQTYLERIKSGKAACIDKLCITPQELTSRLGEFGQFCPVSLAESYELFDCSLTKSLKFAAEFRGHYYKMNSQEKLNKFLESPELYVPPLAPYPLPSPDMIPKRLTLSELKCRFPKCAELQGYCPVTYQDGKQRYEALIPGNINYALEYRDRIYICETEEKLQKFFRSPLKYWNQKLPNKLPPLKEPIFLTSLPLPGYLEQGVATSLIKAMNAAGCLKPKFPFLSIRRSALLFIALHLKAFNPKGSEYTRKKYKKKMDQFIERCELITYLGTKMTRKYKEPQYRAIDFDHKLQTFLALRNIDPING